jgi:hypothetical protein
MKSQYGLIYSAQSHVKKEAISISPDNFNAILMENKM